MRMAKSGSIKMAVILKAKPSEVFKALTNSRSILKWSGQRGKVEATIGGTFQMFDGWVKGKVLAYQNGKTLTYTWHPSDWSKETKSSIVTFKFTASGKNTKVLLTHNGFPDDATMKEHRAGWTEHVFDPLREFLDTEEA